MYKVKRKPTLEEFKQMTHEQRRHPLLWRFEWYRRSRYKKIMEVEREKNDRCKNNKAGKVF